MNRPFRETINIEVIVVIGKRLEELRKSKGMRQYELADIIGTKKAAVSSYESDNSTPNDKIKSTIARYFDVSLDYLLGIIDQPVPYYREDSFLILPDSLSKDDRHALTEFLGYLMYKKQNTKTDSGV